MKKIISFCKKKKMGIIKVGPIRMYAYHGCLPEEEKIGGHYDVTVEIETDFSEVSTNSNVCATFVLD